jgi:hypothetical protein
MRDTWIRKQEVKELEVADRQKEVMMLRDTLIAAQSFITNDLKRRWSEDPDVRKRLRQEMEPEIRAELTASIRQAMDSEIAALLNQKVGRATKEAAHTQSEQAKKDATEIERLNNEIDRLCREIAVLEGSRERDLAASRNEAAASAKRDADEMVRLQREVAALKTLAKTFMLQSVREGEDITPERLLVEITSRDV